MKTYIGLALAATIGVLCTPRDGNAFRIETNISDGCHETMAAEALLAADWPHHATPAEFTTDQQRLADALPVTTPGIREDPWLLALIIGVRFNDLHGFESFDVADLAGVHNDPEGQVEHCLRRPQDDGPEGDRGALDACAEFIMEQVALAAGGDEIDLQASTQVLITLPFRGMLHVTLPAYPFFMGRALHALQDSFTHTLRSENGEEIFHVLNYLDTQTGSYLPERDGLAHFPELDECSESAQADQRRQWATAASERLLSVVWNDSATPSQAAREIRVRALLDGLFVVRAGCTFENDYCDSLDSLPAG